jgi:hypothetical protein
MNVADALAAYKQGGNLSGDAASAATPTFLRFS